MIVYYAGCFLLTLVIYTHISACKNENILNYKKRVPS